MWGPPVEMVHPDRAVVAEEGGGEGFTDAVEGKGPRSRPQKRLDRRLVGVAKSVGGRLLSVTNAIEAGTCLLGDNGWA